jgi:hypothetical protein
MSAPAPSFTDLVNGAAGLVVVLSGLVAAATRSVAILYGWPEKAVERATAIGFLAGAGIAVLVLGISLVGR